MKMSNKTYDVLKYVALTVFPALVIFSEAMEKIWGWPAAVTATIAAVAELLGLLLKNSSKNYWEGIKESGSEELDYEGCYENGNTDNEKQ